MPHLLFKLNGVAEDEAEEIRHLLDAHHVDYYETDAGRFGISLAAIWLPDDGEIERATQLLDDYQQERYHHARAAYEQRLRDGSQETHLQRLLHQPLRTLLYLLVIAVILYFSLAPFLMLIER